jgi:hypothetical protein
VGKVAKAVMLMLLARACLLAWFWPLSADEFREFVSRSPVDALLPNALLSLQGSGSPGYTAIYVFATSFVPALLAAGAIATIDIRRSWSRFGRNSAAVALLVSAIALGVAGLIAWLFVGRHGASFNRYFLLGLLGPVFAICVPVSLGALLVFGGAASYLFIKKLWRK